jgi:hypothetical protein
MTTAARDDRALLATRRTLHGIAEHVLAAYERSVTGTIRLTAADAGLRTQQVDADPAVLELRAEGGAAVLVRHPDGRTVPVDGRLGDIAERIGVRFGLPDPPYPPASGCDAESVAVVDPAALGLLVRAWRDGDTALRLFAGIHAELPAAPGATEPVVWPEHLDVALTLDAVNYGVSPGDAYLGEPYAYVGPHVARTGPFWQAPFGAAEPLSRLPDAASVLGFFERGRELAAAPDAAP